MTHVPAGSQSFPVRYLVESLRARNTTDSSVLEKRLRAVATLLLDSNQEHLWETTQSHLRGLHVDPSSVDLTRLVNDLSDGEVLSVMESTYSSRIETGRVLQRVVQRAVGTFPQGMSALFSNNTVTKLIAAVAPSGGLRPIGREDLILIVDDQSEDRLNAHWIFSSYPNRLDTESYTTALQMLEENPDIRLVVTDINMFDDGDGLQLGRKIRELYPHIHVVIRSNNRRAWERGRSQHGDMFPFIDKMDSQEDVIRRIESLK